MRAFPGTDIRGLGVAGSQTSFCPCRNPVGRRGTSISQTRKRACAKEQGGGPQPRTELPFHRHFLVSLQNHLPDLGPIQMSLPLFTYFKKLPHLKRKT